MSIINEKILKPRKILLKEKVGLIEIYDKVKVVLHDHKIFVSDKIFAEQWDVCRNNLGSIKVDHLSETKYFYSLDYNFNKSNAKIVFLVDAKNVGPRKIQVVFIQSPKSTYRYQKTSCQNSVFFDKPEEKKIER